VFAAQHRSSWKSAINYTYTASKPVITPASDVVSPILADIALTMCVGFCVLWRSGSKKPDHTARQSRNQKAGKHIPAGITPEDDVFARRATNLTIDD